MVPLDCGYLRLLVFIFYIELLKFVRVEGIIMRKDFFGIPHPEKMVFKIFIVEIAETQLVFTISIYRERKSIKTMQGIAL